MSTGGCNGEGEGERLAYTVPEGASTLGVSQSFVWKQIKAGVIPVVHMGRRTLIRRADLLQTLDRLQAQRDGSQDQGHLRVMK